ncbi:MAG: oxidoreductase [Burkholderiaceae bacterium]|nr:MAG: oxidoreductase [Burkholderiaceae bacterium]
MSTKTLPTFDDPGTGTGEYSRLRFLVQSILGTMGTSTLVRVVAVTNSGGLSPVGFIDAQPLVNQTDAVGHVVPHGVLHHLPYFRLQGGANAVILDPQPGDIGIAVFASRDLSKVKATKAQAAPGSARMFSMSDGLYIGGLLNGTPSQYVQFNAGGITLTSPSAITLNAPECTINANTTVNGTFSQGMGAAGGTATMLGPVTVTNDVSAGGKSLTTHVHSGVQTGSGNTGEPL